MMVVTGFRSSSRGTMLQRCTGFLSPLSKYNYEDYMPPTLATVQQQDVQHRYTSNTQEQQHCNSSSILTNDGLATSHIGLNPQHNIRHAPMVYHDHYSCPNWPTKHRFPMAKFTETYNSLLFDNDEYLIDQQLVLSKEHLYKPISYNNFPIHTFISPPLCPTFLQSFIQGTLTTDECRKIGFREQTKRPELIQRSVLEVAGTILTCQLAIKYGLASNLAGGTHHAECNKGKGFTILNDLAIATRLITWNEEEEDTTTDTNNINLLRDFYREDASPIDRVLVVDCDVHQGDGTATFTYPGQPLHNKLFTLDLHAANNYPWPKESCTYDIGLPDECNDEQYLEVLESSLDIALNEIKPQLIIYNAGVDVYHKDKLGRLNITREGMKQRDLHVIRTCVDRGIPVACVVGGGYDDDVKIVGQRHALVHRVCAQVWRENKMWQRV